jgi:hypothetical protein
MEQKQIALEILRSLVQRRPSGPGYRWPMRWQRLMRLSTTFPSRLSPITLRFREICVGLANSDPRDCASELKDIGVAHVLPKIPLPLRRIEISVPSRTLPEETAGIPVVLEYETKDALLYPPEGFLSMLAFL